MRCNDSLRDENKYLVIESCLLELLSACKLWSGQCSADVAQVIGTLVEISFSCKECGATGTWKNQSFHNKMPALNLLLSAAIGVSGKFIYKSISGRWYFFPQFFFSVSPEWDNYNCWWLTIKNYIFWWGLPSMHFHFPGATTSKVLRIFDFMSVKVINSATYYRHIDFYVQPTIVMFWKDHERQLFEKLEQVY